MGDLATTTSVPELLVGFLKNNSSSSDTSAVSMFSRHIDRAEARVKSALAVRYSLPFSPVPPEVRRIAEDIACYFAIRGAHFQDSREKNEYLEEFKTAFDDLKDIVENKTKLAYTDGSLVPVIVSSTYLSSTENYTPVFGLDEPTQWQRDEDEVDDQESARG